MKPWIFYVILAWQIGPLAPEQQKTLILQFDSLKECQSIAEQVESQIKQMQSIFHLKQISCLSCKSLYGKGKCKSKTKSKGS
ncbi:MAG: hypothetical protein WAN86_24425 [Hyphomicrobiaceae bacterium]